jgi:hypothetical protein
LSVLVLGFGCLTPTEITVRITSKDLSCEGGALAFGDLDVLARPGEDALRGASVDGTSAACDAKGGVAELGSIVLTPRDPRRHAEVLVVAGAKLPQASPPVSSTADQCLEQYRAFLAAGAPSDYCKDPAHPCGACIVARRGVGFVDHQRLELDVELAAECAGVFCQADQTCGKNGRCVSATTKCAGPQCSIDVGQGGGATGGAGGAGGTGGQGGGCADPVGATQLAFVEVPGVLGTFVDVAADGAGEAWVTGTQALYRCAKGGCANVPLPGLPQNDTLGRVAASGAVVGVALVGPSAGLVYGTGGSTLAGFFPGSCNTLAYEVSDVSATPSGVVWAGPAPKQGDLFVSAAGDALCGALLEGPASGAARTWAQPGGGIWLAGTDALYWGQGSTTAQTITIPGTNLDLWGTSGPGSRETVFLCGDKGIHWASIDPASPNVIASAQLSPTRCSSISGVARCDGTVDLWALEANGAQVSGYHVGVNGLPASPLPLTHLLVGGVGTGISADAGSIWLTTTTTIEVSPRVVLP